ncbi:MAG: potassium channel protein [Gemmatimonadota bacterium]
MTPSKPDVGQTRSDFTRRFAGVVGLVVALVVVGTLGFLQFPGWNVSDAVYMTVITLTSVGYQEVHPLTDAGRVLAGFLLAAGLTTMGLWFVLITSSLVEMDLAHVFRTRRAMKQISKLRDHTIVCGIGRTGRQVVRELEDAREPYIVVDKDGSRIEQLREEYPEALALEADATRDESLTEAGILDSQGLVAALSADADNVFVCLTARDLQPDLNIVARAYDAETVKKLRKAGADHVVSPNLTGGIRMASMLLRPQVMSFLDVVTRGEDISLRLEQVTIPDGSRLDGCTLAEARIRQETGLVVIAVRHPDQLAAVNPARSAGEGPLAYNPGPEEPLHAGDTLIVLADETQIDSLRTVAA